jgi:hypothetical protein
MSEELRALAARNDSEVAELRSHLLQTRSDFDRLRQIKEAIEADDWGSALH